MWADEGGRGVGGAATPFYTTDETPLVREGRETVTNQRRILSNMVVPPAVPQGNVTLRAPTTCEVSLPSSRHSQSCLFIDIYWLRLAVNRRCHGGA